MEYFFCSDPECEEAEMVGKPANDFCGLSDFHYWLSGGSSNPNSRFQGWWVIPCSLEVTSFISSFPAWPSISATNYVSIVC